MEEETKATETEIKRDERGLYLPGNPPGPGRPPETQEQKIIKRTIKEIVKEYKENLAAALPQIEPVIIEKAVKGDMSAVKEIHDRVMGKSEQKTDITSGGEAIQPVLVKFLNGKPDNN